MNQQTVVIKSNKYGITLFLDKDTAFRESAVADSQKNSKHLPNSLKMPRWHWL